MMTRYLFLRSMKQVGAKSCGLDLSMEKTVGWQVTWADGAPVSTAVSSEARAKLREWAVLAGKGWLLLLGSVVLASLKAPV